MQNGKENLQWKLYASMIITNKTSHFRSQKAKSGTIRCLM